MGLHALIKWIELPPKWDVVPVKDISGTLKEGVNVKARFKNKMCPATIIQLGKYLPTNLVLSGGCDLGVNSPCQLTLSGSIHYNSRYGFGLQDGKGREEPCIKWRASCVE